MPPQDGSPAMTTTSRLAWTASADSHDRIALKGPLRRRAAEVLWAVDEVGDVDVTRIELVGRERAADPELVDPDCASQGSQAEVEC
jgi:hypothetical protein